MSEKWVAVARIVLGLGQMTAAFVAAGLLIVQAPPARVLAAVIVACALTTVSLLVFRRQRR
jgi:hypothetical protein